MLGPALQLHVGTPKRMAQLCASEHRLAPQNPLHRKTPSQVGTLFPPALGSSAGVRSRIMQELLARTVEVGAWFLRGCNPFVLRQPRAVFGFTGPWGSQSYSRTAAEAHRTHIRLHGPRGVWCAFGCRSHVYVYRPHGTWCTACLTADGVSETRASRPAESCATRRASQAGWRLV